MKRIRREAAEWLARKQAGFQGNEAERFVAWRHADPRHRVMFEEVEAAWSKFDCLAFYPGAAGTAPDADFVQPRRRGGRRWAWPIAIAAAACLALVWVGSGHWLHRAGSVPSEIAASGEVDFVHLADGSEVELHPGAVVREEFTAAERRIRLVKGEAEFSVAHNKARPFIVEAEGVAIRAVGTQFDVRLSSAAVDVLVSEGTVQVSRPDMERTVTARQRTTFPTGTVAAGAALPSVQSLADAEIDRALAWQQDRLVFDATPLSEVAARVNLHAANRRDPMHWVLGDAEVGAIRVSGRISDAALGDFVTVLQNDFGVDAERRPGGRVVLTRRPR